MAGLIWNFPLDALILCGLINPEFWSCHFETDQCSSAARPCVRLQSFFYLRVCETRETSVHMLSLSLTEGPILSSIVVTIKQGVIPIS